MRKNLFNVSDTKSITYRHYAAGGNYGWGSIEEKMIIAKTVRLIIGNPKTGEVYFDKTYPPGKK